MIQMNVIQVKCVFVFFCIKRLICLLIFIYVQNLKKNTCKDLEITIISNSPTL